ncbi:MAG: UPF0179 family protein [Halodesulfurarchaeum sp.]
MPLSLVGTRLADPGEEFVFQGEASGCTGCPYRKQCLNLSPGTRYEITAVRDGGQVLDCAVHDEGVIAVEVEPTDFDANVPPTGAFAGSKTTLAGECPHTGCPSHHLCVPLGVDFDREYRITEMLGDPPHEHCALDRELTKVRLAPPED